MKALITFAIVVFAALNVVAQEKKIFYAIYDFDDSTMTYRYDGDIPNNAHDLLTDKFFFKSDVRKIIIDSSMRNFRPDSCRRMFYRYKGVVEIDGLEYLNPPLNGDMSEMFAKCSDLQKVDLSRLNTKSVKNMSRMLEGCQSLSQIDVSKFDTKDVTDMSMMFYECEAVKTFDLSNFDTRNVKNMSWMFHDCKNIDSLDLTSFDTRSIYRMENMFDGCLNLKYIDLSSFNTDNIAVMCNLFADCISLKTLDLSSFVRWQKYTSYSNIDGMFKGCTMLTTIFAGCNWNMDGFADRSVFLDCYSLCGGKGTRYIGYSNGDEYARIDNGAKQPGYFTLKGQQPYSPKEYAVLRDSVLTFYYSEQRPSDADIYTPGGFGTNADCVKKVVFDKSFKNYYPKSCAGWFKGLHNLQDISGINEYLNTDSVTRMEGMFKDCSKITSLDLSGFKTAKVTDMDYMFEYCRKLHTIIVGDGWNVDSVKYSEYMFAGCWDLYGSQGTEYEWIEGTNEYVKYARVDEGNISPGYLTAVGQEAFMPSKHIESPKDTVISTQKQIDYSHLFSPVVDSLAYAVLQDSVLTFYYGSDKPDGAFQIKSYKPLCKSDLPSGYSVVKDYDLNVRSPQWSNRANEIKKVVFDPSFIKFRPTSCYEWFSGCGNLTDIFGLNKNLNTEDVVYMSAMFLGCVKLKDIDLSGFRTPKLKSTHSMFSGCVSLENIDLNTLKSDSLQSVAMMFDGCYHLKNIKFGNFNTSSVKNMGRMFNGCKCLETIDLSTFNTSNCENMSFMFAESGIRDIDLSGFQFKSDVNNCQCLEGVFMNCSNLESLDISHFVNVGYSKGMFFGCSSLKELKLFEPCFDDDDDYTIGDLTGLFYGCSSLEELDLSVLKRVRNPKVSYMFANCTNLKTIYVDDDWKYNCATTMYYESLDGTGYEQIVYSPIDASNVFDNCYNLVGGNGTRYDPNNKDVLAMLKIDRDGAPAYFTKKNQQTPKSKKSAILIPAMNQGDVYYNKIKEVIVNTSKWGFVNEYGEWIISPKYDNVNKFESNGTAEVSLDGKTLHIDKNGNIIPDLMANLIVELPLNKNNKYDDNPYTEFSVAQENGLYGYKIDGRIAIEPKYDYAWNFDQYGFAQVKLDGKIGFIDSEGKEVSGLIFDAVNEEYWQNCKIVSVMIDGKWCFFDKITRRIVGPMFDHVCPFDRYGYARVKLNEKWGFIDANGEYALEPIVDEFKTFDDDCCLSVLIDGKWGVVDSTRTIAIRPQFEDVDAKGFNYARLVPAKINGKYGYIDINGQWKIKPKFDYASIFYNTYTRITINGQGGLISRNGKYYLIPKDFDGRIEEGDFMHLPFARITTYNKYSYSNNKVGLVDKKGKILFDPKFVEIKFFNGVIMAKECSGCNWGIIDKHGNWKKKPSFQSIGNEYRWDY